MTGEFVMVVAHPDDEIIGAANYLANLPESARRDVVIVYATGGVPRDLHFTHEAGFTNRQEYANARRTERDAALRIAGIQPDQCIDLDYTDQEVCFCLPELIGSLSRLIRELQPERVLTHPYEGGHPDHDACALACRRSADIGGAAVIEFACYHRGPTGFIAHEFLPSDRRVSVMPLDGKEQARKKRMYECHRSQQQVLQAFSTVNEKFRPAPVYDFHEPPHWGTLHYETLGWEIQGHIWREAAAQS